MHFQVAPDSYGSPPGNIFQAPDNYGAPQFGNNNNNTFNNNNNNNYNNNNNNNNNYNNINNADADVSLATIRIVDPPNSVRSGNNPFLDTTGSAGRSKPYQDANFLAQQSQPVPTLQNANPNVNNLNGNRFTPEFIPSMRLPDNFEPNLDAMIIKTTERNDLLKKMKFPTEDPDVEDNYGHTNGLLRAQINNVVETEPDKPQAEILDEASDDSEYEEDDEEDGQDTDEEYEDVELVNKNPEPPVGVGKMGKPAATIAETPKAAGQLSQLDNIPESEKTSLKTDEAIDDKTLEKVLENILAEVEQTDNEEENSGQNLRQKKKRRIHPSQTLYGRKIKRRKTKIN